ncbi:MAG TPA: UDP-glucose/GDP-mannose dehydrogenase family protein [Candidatus Polarisedimenticolia bacterium]|nr:UDP-glucose/GDP-mannose dehydrogenase family protein [Candidatus Polarisedimenticolia bacterium]
MNIAVIGTGYVGLVTGACFAELGVSVTCIDNDERKIARLNEGVLPIYEPGLEEMVHKNVRQGRLSFTTDLAQGVGRSLVVLIAVGTPPDAEGNADLTFVKQVAAGIGKLLREYKVIVTKSTVPMGTGALIRRIIEENRPSPAPFSVASNPEFLREGSAVEDFMRPNRVVVGTEDSQAAAILKDLYRPLYLIETPFVVTDVVTAEMIKYASNAFLATKISFINEMANLCDRLGADVHDVAKAMGLDNRIGRKFLHPGPGYGGSCFPKDTSAVLAIARAAGYNLKVVEAVIAVNDRQPAHMLEKVRQVIPDGRGRTAAVLGLSFKPNTDDIRESPAIKVIEGLQEMGLKVKAYDPIAMDNARPVLPAVAFCDDEYSTVEGADLLVLATEWNQFRALDLKRVRGLMKSPVVVDLRNIYEPEDMARLGFTYRCVGRPVVSST